MSNPILLIKTKNIDKINNPINYYLRKLGTGGYVRYGCVCLVDKENKLTGIVNSNACGIVCGAWVKNDFAQEEFELTNNQYNKLISYDGKLLLISLVDTKKLDEPLEILEKPVRGLRFATFEEEKKLWLWYVSSLFNFEEVSSHEIFYGSERLNKIYAYCMELDILKYYFHYLDKGGFC